LTFAEQIGVFIVFSGRKRPELLIQVFFIFWNFDVEMRGRRNFPALSGLSLFL